MNYSDDVIMDIRNGNDIVDVIGEYVKLTRKGANYFGLCPFHGEKTASFSVNREKQIFHCFGCGVGGGVFKFIELKENFTFSETVEFLAKRINYNLPTETQSKKEAYKRELKEKLWEIHKTAARFYYDCLNTQAGKIARDYLDMRQVNEAVRKKFGLGYSPDDWTALNDYLLKKGFDQETILESRLVKTGKSGRYYDTFRNRLMFPIIDTHGHVVAFGSRKLSEDDKMGKYVNSPETVIYRKSFNPYNINLARLSNRDEFIIVEGNMDAIMLYQAGFKNVIATMGTAFNDGHASVIKRYVKSVIALFDSDEAGEKAALKAIPVLQRAGIKVKVLQVTGAKDPDEYIKKYGSDAFAKLLKTAVNQVLFRVNILKKRYSLDDPDDVISLTQGIVEILSEIDNMIELDVYINNIVKDIPVSPDAIRADIQRIKGITAENGSRIDRKVKNVIVNNKLEDAKSSLIDLLAADKQLFERIQPFFDKKEFDDELYIKIYDIIERLHSQNKPAAKADIMTLLDTEDNEEQSKRAALIFMRQMPYETPQQKHEALIGALKTIKENHIDNLINNAEDDMQVMQLIEQKKKTDTLLAQIL